jgi:gliding motility-associated-like protein
LVRRRLFLACFLITAASQLSAQNNPGTFEFVENKGQWENNIQFKGELSSGEFYLQKKGFLVALHDPKDLAATIGHHSSVGGGNTKPSNQISYKKDISGVVTDRNIIPGGPGKVIHSHAYAVEFVGSDENAQVVPDKAQSYFNNYFIGNDPTKWARGVKIFGAVLYRNVYPNIDIRYYSESGQLKYDLIIHPGGDPSQIVMKYTGADKLSVKNNELLVKTSVGNVRELYPYSFQTDNIKGKTEIDCKYVVSGNTVKFQLGNYSKKSILVIDPSLIFASFTGSKSDQWGYTATPGPDGSLFSGGIVFGNQFPVTTGAYQVVYGGGDQRDVKIDIGIMKFSPNGSQRVYATYIGGAGNDYPHSLISDPLGNLIVMGRTTSTAGTPPSGYPGTVVGTDEGGSIVVTKLNAAGSNIIGSLVIGGKAADGLNIEDLEASKNAKGNHSLIRNYGDDSRSEVTLDAAGNIYVAAQTQSTNFPVRNAFQSASGGAQDGVVMKINPTCTGIIWASYLGGDGDDGAFVIDVSPVTGNVYVGGGTTSKTSFPGVTAGVKYPAFQGGDVDGYITEISSGGTLIRSSYLGTSGEDIVYGLKIDKLGFPYVMGVSRGGLWPVAGNVLYSKAKASQFVAKLKTDLSDFVYSTTFGSGSPKPNMSPVAFLVDRCENLYISGWGGWIINQGGADPYDQAGVAGMETTGDAIKSITDNQDFYFIVIQKNSSKLLYGTFFGQDGGAIGEHVDGGTSRYDQQGVIYQAICANCAGGARFPTTPGVVGPVNEALPNGCNLAGVKIAFNFAGVASGPESFVEGLHDSVGCAPFTVTLRDTIKNAASYIWKFGDGSPDLSTPSKDDITHIFNSVGTYKVTLIAIDSNSCNVSDTAYTYIRVGDVKADVQMAFNKLGDCFSLNYQFDNLSTNSHIPPLPFDGDSSFIWDFGDGSAPIYTGTGSPTHAYSATGSYPVTLTLIDTNFCNSPVTIDTFVRVNPLVEARFETPAVGCAPYSANFTNTSLAGQTFDWDFGDGSPVNHETNPIHQYPDPGTYIIKLIAYDESTCNKIDDTTMSITVSSKPTAAFTYIPVVPVQNKPNIFTNLSTGGVRFKWMFGDGEGIIKNSMDTVLHQYNASGPFTPCLIAFNEFGCTDTVCQDLVADILPLLDVPNAFTPGKFGKNALVHVEGFGIDQMSWKIYNRFGQKVFETNDRRSSWDGRFNGQLQPMDVYTYTLDVIFSDGKKTRKTGDITLIR